MVNVVSVVCTQGGGSRVTGIRDRDSRLLMHHIACFSFVVYVNPLPLLPFLHHFSSTPSITALQTVVARLEEQRRTDQLRTGGRLLSHAVYSRQSKSMRQRLLTWRRNVAAAKEASRAAGSSVPVGKQQGHAMILQGALARVGTWNELRMRPRFQWWQEWTVRQRHVDRWQPVAARCLRQWRECSGWARGPLSKTCFVQWKRLVALYRVGLLPLNNVSVTEQSEAFLAGGPATVSTPAPATVTPTTASLTAVPAAVDEVKAARFCSALTTLLTERGLQGDLEAVALTTRLICQLTAARQARFEHGKAADAGTVMRALHSATADTDLKLKKQHDLLAASTALVQRGAEEALTVYKESVTRQLHEARVTVDGQLASVHHRLRGLDSDLTRVGEVAQAASHTAGVNNSRLEKALLEQGHQVMRVAGLEQAHTHYLEDRVRSGFYHIGMLHVEW